MRLENGIRVWGPNCIGLVDAVDRDALARLLVRVGQLGCACSSIQEIDINPVMVSNGEPVAVDASVICSG